MSETKRGGRAGGGPRRVRTRLGATMGEVRAHETSRPIPPLGPIVGVVTSLTDKHYGFVTAESWNGNRAGTGPNAGKTPPRYFFHSKGLEEGVEFSELRLGDRVKGEAVVDEAPGGRIKGAMLVKVGRA